MNTPFFNPLLLVMVVFLMSAWPGAVAEVAASEIDVEHVFAAAGSVLTSRIDSNGDDQDSSWCTLQIKGGHQGSSVQQCVNAEVFAGVSADWPGGLSAVTPSMGTGLGARSFPNARDQVFLQLTGREVCVNAFGGIGGQERGQVRRGQGKETYSRLCPFTLTPHLHCTAL